MRTKAHFGEKTPSLQTFLHTPLINFVARFLHKTAHVANYYQDSNSGETFVPYMSINRQQNFVVIKKWHVNIITGYMLNTLFIYTIIDIL